MGRAVLHTAFGESKSPREWALDPRCAVNYVALTARLTRGWGVEAALVIPADATARRYHGWNDYMNLVGWLADSRCAVSASVLWERLGAGEPFESALSRPDPAHPPEVFKLKKSTHAASSAADRKYVAFGEAKSLVGWSRDERCRCSLATLKSKLYRGVALDAAILFGTDYTFRSYWAFGEIRQLGGWLRDKRCKIPAEVLKARLDSGERFESAVTRPPDEPLLEYPNQYGIAGRQRADLEGALEQLEEDWSIIKLTLFAETKTANQWTHDPRCEISYPVLWSRVRAGWPEDERILQLTEWVSPLTEPAFNAVTAEGVDLGDFRRIREAEAAILAKSAGGTIFDRIRHREIPIPRVKKARNPSKHQLEITAWGETKSGVAWEEDPRCAVELITLYARLRSRRYPWTPEDAISTPPSDNFMRNANKMRARFFEGFGESKTIAEWALDPRCKVVASTLRQSLGVEGIPVEQALLGTRKTYEAFGESKGLWEWVRDKRCEVSCTTLKLRLGKGIPMERALKRGPRTPDRKAQPTGFST